MLKNLTKFKKLMKYTKKIQNNPNLSKEFQIIWDEFIKKLRQKKNKKNPRVPYVALGE
jgi:hypothetical protein